MSDLSFLDFEADFSSPQTIAAYDELPLWSAMFGLLLLELVPLVDVTNVLDVGCGTGFPLIELAERLGPRTSVHGVDPWSAGMRRAAEKIALRGTPNVTLHDASAVAMPFADATFDLVVSNLGVNNFDDAPAAIRECRRVARQGATFALTTNLQGHMREVYGMFASVLTDDDARARLDAHVRHRATIDSVRTLLTNADFEVTRVVEREAVMRFANGTALFHHHFIKLGFLDAWKQIVPGAERETFARLVAELDRRGELRLTIPMAYVESRAV
jgi:SAM-dependent methyltransferase